MKKTAKVHAWLKGFLLTILLHSGVYGFTAIPVYQPVTCIINDLQQNGISQSTVSYSWSPVSGATAYKVYYVRLSDGYTSAVTTSSSTTYTSPQLAAGGYRFYFAPVCGSGTLSYIADEVIIS